MSNSTVTALKLPNTCCCAFSRLAACCDSSKQSVRAQHGTPISGRKLSSTGSVHPVDMLSVPVARDSYLSRLRINTSPDSNHASLSVLPGLTLSSVEPTDLYTTVNHAESTVCNNAELQSVDNVSVTQANVTAPNSDNMYLNDIDLLCSIAETYELGDDSDAISYLSNCLHNKSWSLQRRPYKHEKSLSMSAALGSDQLYPDCAVTRRTNKPKAQKHRRRRSIATSTSTSNVYVNEKGKPLIV